MSLLPHHERSKILEYLNSVADQRLVDEGSQLANQGAVSECSRSGSEIRGLVRGQEEKLQSPSLRVISSREITPNCSCGGSLGQDSTRSSWCAHALALLLRANELGFLSSDSGFAARESTYRISTFSAEEIASVLRELSTVSRAQRPETTYHPQVEVLIEPSGDRLGVQVLFDDTVQEPVVFEGFKAESSRTLDNLLIEVLDEEGSWDEERKLWYVSSSKGIELLLGILAEYDSLFLLEERKRLRLSKDLLDAKLIISWKRSGADLAVKWLMPAGAPRDKDEDLIGTGPFWAVIEQNIYKLSPSAARIASLFPYASQISLTRSQIGPLLEVVASESYSSQFLEIHNSNLQPAAEIHPPKIVLEVNLREDAQEHFGTSSGVNLIAQLAFEYPSPPPDSNSVYLPDRDKEREAVELLYSLGFDYDRERKRYQISGGAALDLVHSAPKTFPAAWDVRGFTSLKKKIRRADLTVNISLASAVDQTRSGAGKARETEEKIDWFDCHVSLSLNNANVPISTLFKSSQAEMGGWVKLENGSYARVPSGSLQQLKTTLGLLDPNFKLSNTLRSRLSMAQALGLSKLDDQLVNVTVDKSLKALARRLEDFQGVQKVKLSKNFSGNLRPYQHEGLSWLSFLYDFELGGILADEMGLGKTVQTLALVNTLKDRLARQGRKLKPVLVVAPTSVITNWCYEAHRFTPKLKVLLLHGAARKRLFSDAADYDLVVTSYALLRLDRYELERIPFSIAVLDEAQQIKNYQAATTAAAKALRAERRLALSGTPTENRPMELWSIMDFLMPGYLGTNEFFRNYIEKPILEGGPGVEVAKFLRNKTRPFILRRTKAEVEKDLPPKIESVLYTSMTDSQRDLYSHILAEVKPRVFDAVERKGIAAASVSILAALLRLRQVCNHPNSIDALKNIEGYDSGKFNLLQDILDEALESGRKILLFCQFKEMLAIIRRHVEARRISYLYLDGATRQRQQLVDRFNSDSSVKLFLISLKAGGLGLNLAAADTVIIYDPWWNPAVESQAVDRAHRIGQRRTVTVYRLVTADSVEQKIMQLKRKKSAIVDALINKNAISTLTLTKGELEALFEAPPVELSSEGGG